MSLYLMMFIGGILVGIFLWCFIVWWVDKSVDKDIKREDWEKEEDLFWLNNTRRESNEKSDYY